MDPRQVADDGALGLNTAEQHAEQLRNEVTLLAERVLECILHPCEQIPVIPVNHYLCEKLARADLTAR